MTNGKLKGLYEHLQRSYYEPEDFKSFENIGEFSDIENTAVQSAIEVFSHDEYGKLLLRGDLLYSCQNGKYRRLMRINELHEYLGSFIINKLLMEDAGFKTIGYDKYQYKDLIVALDHYIEFDGNERYAINGEHFKGSVLEALKQFAHSSESNFMNLPSKIRDWIIYEDWFVKTEKCIK